MKKTVFFLMPVVLIILAISCEVETNYTEDGHFGKAVIHNNSPDITITRIIIDDTSYWNERYYNERVSITPGKSSDVYELKLTRIYDILFNGYKVTITFNDDSTKSCSIEVYEDIVNKLYFDGTNLVEKQ